MANLSYHANKPILSRMCSSTIMPLYLHHCQVTLPCPNKRRKQLFTWGFKTPSSNIFPSDNPTCCCGKHLIYIENVQQVMMQWCSKFQRNVMETDCIITDSLALVSSIYEHGCHLRRPTTAPDQYPSLSWVITSSMYRWWSDTPPGGHKHKFWIASSHTSTS